ncbi:putative dehydrogenase/threonine dehydrogenase-like Zn-dependent dehydrogenase [Nocardioides marinisabuli]|uniref:Putative dehydrogenase/threonine dehydrogenase-like Zn-dependent dehydrogenase n=1 Tax=Nocardioides marinisabuli TaxID=419476 RepID=A0A7Y9EY03_9ACTN|nr:bi-domain-containing oxidoreductase [Nocardioides marinisabuli]NYD55954.1 putative dehydrogenase/threonine dehydrogenase-like Zn-dependent dehydrogenase [Nocardioides marinisabuli]
MWHVAQNYSSGELAVLDAPVPSCRPGGVLVRTSYSLISTGTELMKVSEARMSLLAKARHRPDQVRQVLDAVAANGAVATYRKTRQRLDSWTPLGYSLCGVVVEVGQGVQGLEVGDLVAAAGNEFALHAEVNWVPRNLCVRVPDGVLAEHAAFATVGAIAMQALRRAEVQLGETACVVGLGLVGQLLVRLLVNAGVRVVGVDTLEERCRTAEEGGAIGCAGPDPTGVAGLETLLRAGAPGGADHVFLAAGGTSNGPVELAARLARDRACVVDIGKTRLDLPWNAYYEKELDVRFSRSYGPGRYDDRYEIDGIDYPLGYVRWTEERNIACFLALLADGSLDISGLVSSNHPVTDAPAVYDELRSGGVTGVGHLLSYPARDGEGPAYAEAPVRPVRRATRGARPRSGAVRLGVIGAGSHASSMLLPGLAAAGDVDLVRVATATSLSSINAQRAFGFASAGTDAQAVVEDDTLDAVLVATRHRTHADLVCAALESGKAVYVEKPLALSEEELGRVEETMARTGNERLMVGFNRRFAPSFLDLRRRFGGEGEPVSLRYLVNAGRLGASSWYLDRAEGSRFVGEGGHFIDLLSAWTGEDPVDVCAQRSGDGQDVSVLLRFAGGSLGTITYATGGSRRCGKESLDVLGGGRSALLDNFVRTTVWSERGRDVRRSRTGPDKGHRAAVAAFVTAVRTGGPMPIDPASLVTTTRTTLEAAR